MARRRAVAHRGRQRQRVEWTASIQDDLLGLAANSVSILGASAGMVTAVNGMTSPTLVRCRGELLVLAGATGTAGDDVLVGAGLCIVSERASTAGAASVPRPLSDISFSWLWHTMFMLKLKTSADEFTPDANMMRVPIESKAMRKILSDEEELIFVIETDNGAGTASILFAAQLRALFKES